MKILRGQSTKGQKQIYDEKIRSFILANIHVYLFKIYTIKEVVGTDHFPKSEELEKMIEQFSNQWPYTIPDYLRNDFMNKMTTIFKKKFVGEDRSEKKASETIELDFNFGRNKEEFQP